MSYPVTLVSLIQQSKQRSNLEGAQAFIPDQEWTTMVNSSIASWYDVVRGSTWGGQYYRAQYSFQTNVTNPGPGSIMNPPPGSYYQLPKNFLALTSVDVFISETQVLPCRAFQEEQRNLYRWYPIGWFLTTTILYQLWGGNIVFIPAPQGTFGVQLNYVPTAPQLFNSLDFIDTINGWEEYIILDVAIKALIKYGQEDMIPLLQGRLADEKARIKSMAPKRDMGMPEVVHEIDEFNTGWLF